MAVYIQGLLLGLAYVAPIGMQNVFVIQNALTDRRRQAFLTALFVTVNDVLLAMACFWGVGALLDRYGFLRVPIAAAGAVFILYVAWTLIRKSADDMEAERRNISSPLKLFATCFAVTWLNPQALIDGTLLFGGMRASLAQDVRLFFMLGVASASALWFSTVATLVYRSSNRFTPKVQQTINRICAVILILFAVKLGISVI